MPRALLGWDVSYTKLWTNLIFAAVRPEREQYISQRELYKALSQRAELRPLLMACEPRDSDGPVDTRGGLAGLGEWLGKHGLGVGARQEV